MDQKPREVVIGDNTFYIRRINAMDAWKIFGDLQRELMPSISELLLGMAAATKPNAEISEEEKAREGRVMAEGINKLSERLSGDQLERWTKKLIDPDYVSVSINGMEPTKLDARMQAMAFEDFTVIPHLIFEVIKFNFAGPIMGFLSRIGLDTSKINAVIPKL